jgi:2-dehydropantoate 2-reductase
MQQTNKNNTTLILIVGAGAIGGFIGGALAALSSNNNTTNNKVTLLARGQHLKALQQQKGLKLIIDAESNKKKKSYFITENINAVGNLSEAYEKNNQKPFDIIFLTVKAHQLLDIARDPAWKRNIHSHTIIVPLQNGIPWYTFLQLPSSHPFSGRQLKSVDPTGELAMAFPTSQVIGAIAMPACTMRVPGEVIHEGNWAIPIANGYNPVMAQQLIDVMSNCGFKMQPHQDFLEELFIKSLGSAIFNPASALTGATLGELADEHDIFARQLCLDAMTEIRSVAKIAMQGKEISITNEQRLRGAGKLGFHKTSMLQDVLAGKYELEIECIVGAVVEVSSWCNIKTPVLATLYRLIKLKQRVMMNEVVARNQQHNLNKKITSEARL